MRLRAIRLRDVRQFGRAGGAIEGIADGVNVLAAPNEFGKTTIFDALRTALFYKHSSRHRTILSLVPEPEGGAPEIELDLDTPAGVVRLHKRFISTPGAWLVERKSGVVLARGDAVDDWLKGHLEVATPDASQPRLLWVNQGTSLDDLTKLDAAPVSIGELVAREVGDIASGDRVRRVLDRARTERSKLVTEKTQNPRRGSEYEQAIEQLAALDRRVEQLTARVDAAEEALDRLARIDQQLAETAAGDEERRLEHQLETAAAKLSTAQLAAERHAIRTRERDAACAALDRAAMQRDDLARAQASAAAKHRELARARAELDAAIRAKETADVAETRARHAREGCQRAWQEAAALAARARQAAVARTAAAEVQKARERLAELQKLDEERREKARLRKAIPLDRQRLDTLEELYDAWRQLRARLLTRRPTVVVAYAADAVARVRHDGEPLAADVAHSVETATRLDLDGIGSLVIDPGGAGAELEAQIADASAELSEALRAADVPDIAAARERLREADALDYAVGALERRLKDAAPEGLNALADHLADLEVATAVEIPSAPDQNEAEAAEEAARAAATEADRAWRERLEAAGPAREHVATLKSEVQALGDRATEAQAQLGPESAWRAALAEAETTVATARAALDTAVAVLGEAAAEPGAVASAEAEIQRLRQALRNHRERIEQLRIDRAHLSGELHVAAADGVGERLAEAVAEREQAARRVAVFEEQEAALGILIDELEAAAAAARERFAAPVLATMTPLLHQVLPAAEIDLSDEFAPRAVRRRGRSDAVERLSGGTREQLAVLTRLGFATLMARHGEHLPVILDDALVFSDDERIERMFTALTMAGDAVQVLVLTCRERSFRTLGGHPLRVVPWPASEG